MDPFGTLGVQWELLFVAEDSQEPFGSTDVLDLTRLVGLTLVLKSSGNCVQLDFNYLK